MNILKCLQSTYHGSKKEEFYLQILDEDVVTPTGFVGTQEPCYKVKAFDGQGYKTDTTWLRKSLIGTLYEVVDTPQRFLKTNMQLSIFDFI